LTEERGTPSKINFSRPFFERVKVKLPLHEKPLVVKSPGASEGNIYVKALSIDGKATEIPIVHHDQLISGGTFKFEMASTPQSWGSSTSESR
jgi:putative alpha-1,2-mannosidase